MLHETGRIIALEEDAVWVETIQQSTCGSCAAQKGCGQSMLAKLGAKPAYLRVLLPASNPRCYTVNQTVTIGIPDDVVVKGSLFVYFTPLLLMMAFAGLAHTYQSAVGSDTLPILAGIVGLLTGGLIVRWCTHYARDDVRLQPVVINNSPDSIEANTDTPLDKINIHTPVDI